MTSKFRILLRKAAEQLGLFDMPVQVEGYTRDDGTYVAPHTSRRHKRLGGDKQAAPRKQAEQVDLLTGVGPPEKAPEKPASHHQWPAIVEHVTRKGKTLRGVIVFGITKEQAEGVDPGTFMKDGGWFLREKRMRAAHAEDRAPRWLPRLPAEQVEPADKKESRRPIARPLNGAEGADGGLFGADQEARKDAAERLEPFGVAPGTSKAERRRLNAAAAARADELMAGRSTLPDLSPEDAALLRQYTGTGGIGDSLNEFYTRQDVANAMWSVVGKLVGDAPPAVLEPCCGTGVFLHTAPAGAHVTGVEMDATSGQIATLLHQQHQVRVAPFEDFATGDDRQFDAVIGNVPFGLRGALIKKDKSDLKTAEQYFVDAALDKTRAGGVVALIVPTGIMDGKNSRSFRERILKKGEFVTAFRMPNTAFEAAHTEVTTDIVVFRKRPDDVAGALSTVDRKTMESLGLWDKEFVGGSFFQGRGVDHVFGRPEEGWRAKAGMGNDFTVTGSMDGVAAAIADWTPPEGNDGPELSVASILDALGDDEDAKRRARGAALKVPYRMGRVGDTKVVDGILYVLQGEPPRWHRADDDAKFVSDARSLAQALETLADTAAAGRPADALRDHAKELLDAYIAEHGDPHKSKDLTEAAQSYPEIWRLLGAVKKNGGGYSDLVTRRDSEREEKTDSFAGAVARAMGEGEGSDSFTPEAVAAQWAGGDIQAAMDHLMADDAYATDPTTGIWQTQDNYLSGDLYAKLDAVREALDREDLDAAFRAKYEAQAKALEEAIDPQSLEDVEAQINSGWVPLDVVADFFTSRNAESDSEYVRNLEPISITFENGVFKVTGGGYNLGLISKYLNRTGLREDDQPVIDGWNKQFKEWLLTSRHRDRVEDAYNRAFRSFRAKTFSDRPMEVPGLNPEREVNAYHWPSLRWALSEGKGIIADDVGLGKAQPLDAKILTPTGWVMMGDIKVGDLVIAGDGSPAKVLGVYPQGDKEIFRVSFSDGAATECCEEHLWLTQTYYERNNARRSLSGTGGGKVRPLSEIAKSLRQAGKSHPDGVRNHAIPMVGPVQFAPREVPIDPYLLGVLIGDGCLCHGTPRVSTPDAWIVDEIGRMLPAGIVISKAVDNGRCPEYRLSKAARTFDGNGHNAKNPLKQEIERLGLNVKSEHKFVPDAYLFNSVSARLSMLQGLMDTDGYVCKAGVTVQFSSSSRRLADDVVFLVNSLGGNATMASKIPTFRNTKGEKAEGLEHYTVHMRLPPGIAPFRLPKKADRVRPKSKYLPVRYVEKVESVGMKPAQCIMVDHPSHLYVTDDFIVTHNTLRGLMLARLLKTNGQAKKPLIVVPKSVLANWVAEAEAWFPGSRVMVIGETYSRDKNGELVGKVDSAAERNRKLHNFAQNDYDFAFISMPAWSEIDLSPEKKNAYIENDFWTQRADQLDQAGDKRMRKIREAYEQQVAGRDFEKRTDALYFEGLGVDALIIDEGHCFPAGTLVDGRPIETFKTGDVIRAFDHASGRIVMSRVLNRQVRRAASLYRITLQGGGSIVSTGKHPFFTPNGYVFAEDVTPGDVFYKNLYSSRHGQEKGRSLEEGSPASGDGGVDVRVVLGANEAVQGSGLASSGERQDQVLLQQVACCAVQAGGPYAGADIRRSSGEGADGSLGGGGQSQGGARGLAENAGGPCQSACNPDSERTQAESQGRQWDENADPSSDASVGAWGRLGGGACGENSDAERVGVSAMLQDRRGEPGGHDRNRSGRKLAPIAYHQGPRPEEGGDFVAVRVESVEVLEPGSDGQYGGLCPGGLVYNVEVEHHHNYIAEGILCHNSFKNLYAARSRFGESPKFLGGQGLSNRALDTNLKSQQVREVNGGKGVFMLTATPTKNSPLEIYSMLSHIAPEEFTKRGIKNSEEFLDRYCVFEKDKVLGVNGEIEDALVTAGFKNMDELRAVMSRYIQRRTAEDVGLPLPKPEADMVLVDMSPAQKAVYVELREAAAKAGGADDTGDAHIFSIMDKMGKAAIDLRLLGDPTEPDVPSPKLVKAADVIAEGAKEGGQVVFADHIDLHERLADMLVDRGLKRSEIGIVNAKAASSSAKRQNIQDQFNAGKIKVAIGNTATMGEGMNLQKRTSDIHHLELPWEPASIQQRNGRGLRQGNKREAVRIHTYLSKGSFDGYRYQTLTAKRDWQDLLWKGGNRIENLAREGVFDRNDLMIMLSADPDAERAKVAADKEAALGRAAAEGRAQAAGEFARFAEMTRSMKNLPAGSKSSGRLEARIEAARARLKANPHFAAKAALDAPEGVFVHPATGHAWQAGGAFEIDPKVAEAAKYSERASRWLVTSVKPGEGRLRARPYGSNIEFEFDSKLLSKGITPTAYDKAADSKATADVLAGQVGGPEMNTPKKLVGLDPGMLRERYHDIQAALKEALRTYKAHISDRAALVKDGKPLSVKSYEVNQNLDSADLMLPIPEHRDLAIQAWVDAERAKRPAGKYPATGRRSSYHGGAPIGVEFSYGPLETRNPWEGALKDLFGKESIEEARDKLVASAIAEAKDLDFIGALKVLSSTVRQEPYSTKASWPAESVSALLDKATHEDLVGNSSRLMVNASLHSGLYRHGVPAESSPEIGDDVGTALAKMAIGSGDYALAMRAIEKRAKARGDAPKDAIVEMLKYKDAVPHARRTALRRAIADEALKVARRAGIESDTLTFVGPMSETHRPIGEFLAEFKAENTPDWVGGERGGA